MSEAKIRSRRNVEHHESAANRKKEVKIVSQMEHRSVILTTAGSKKGLEYHTKKASVDHHRSISHCPASTAAGNEDINHSTAPMSRD